MIFRVFTSIVVFTILVMVTSCKTCYQCKVEVTHLDSVYADTATPYPTICGTKNDITGYEDLCKTAFDGDTNTSTKVATRCICQESI